MMGVMTVQPPLPLTPSGAVPFGAVAALVQDNQGGRVFIRVSCPAHLAAESTTVIWRAFVFCLERQRSRKRQPQIPRRISG